MEDSDVLNACWITFLVIAGVVYLVVQRIRKAVDDQNRADAATKAKWDRIRAGMTRQEIEQILGPPHEISAPTLLRIINKLGPVEVWTYGFLGGKINFRQGKVIAYKKPL